MTTSTADHAIAEYLARLQVASAALPPDRRSELLEEIGGHIAAARDAGAAADEAAVRTLLDRLGRPEVIAAAALEDCPPAAAGPGAHTRPPSTALELTAVLMLTAGSFIPVLGWIVGVVLLWISSRWTRSEKLLGTLVVPLGPGGILVLGGPLPAQTCTSSGAATPVGSQELTDTVSSTEVCTGFAFPAWLGTPLLLIGLVAPIIVAVVLYRRARAEAESTPA